MLRLSAPLSFLFLTATLATTASAGEGLLEGIEAPAEVRIPGFAADPAGLLDEAWRFEEELGEEDLPDQEEWSFEAGVTVWAPALHGDVTARGATEAIHTDFSDWFDNIDQTGIPVLLSVNGSGDDWGFRLTGMYLPSESEWDAGPLEIRTEFTAAIVQAAGTLRLADWEGSRGSESGGVVELLAGARYYMLSHEIRIARGGSAVRREADEWWVDPIVGLRAETQLGERWYAEFGADAGGFGVGTASDLSWSATARLGLRVTGGLSLELGYKVLDIDWERGSGARERALDLQLRGPFAALTIDF